MILEIYIMRLRVGLLEIHAVGLSAFKIALFKEIQISYNISYMRNLKQMTQMNFFYKTEIDSQTGKTHLWLPKRKRGEGINWEFGINGYALLYIK